MCEIDCTETVITRRSRTWGNATWSADIGDYKQLASTPVLIHRSQARAPSGETGGRLKLARSDRSQRSIRR